MTLGFIISTGILLWAIVGMIVYELSVPQALTFVQRLHRACTRHELWFLLFGPLTLIRKVRTKICPVCFGLNETDEN